MASVDEPFPRVFQGEEALAKRLAAEDLAPAIREEVVSILGFRRIEKNNRGELFPRVIGR